MKKSSAKHSKQGHRYNWRPDLPDQRDFLYSVHAKIPPAKTLPSQIDLREHCSPVFDQGRIGSCTGNSLAGALEFLQLQELADNIDDRTQAQIMAAKKFTNVSRLFIYYNERALEGKVDEDSGATLRDGIKALTQWGACKESSWKYSATNVFKKPSPTIYREALPHKISIYLRLQDLDDMKQCLASGYPFVFGFAVYESFETPQVAKTGVMPMPSKSERMIGGHAVMAVGYDDGAKHLIVRNSWGPKWGDRGYFRMPYDYAESPMLSQDFWTIRK